MRFIDQTQKCLQILGEELCPPSHSFPPPPTIVASPYPCHSKSKLSTIVSNDPVGCRIVLHRVFFLVNCGGAVVVVLVVVVEIDFFFGDVNFTLDFTVHGLLLISSVTGRKLRNDIRS